MSDAELVRRTQEGDLGACSLLFARYWRSVHAWMLGFTQDRDEAEDLTQQTFLRAHERLRQLRNPERFLPWLRKVARTVALGSLRHRAEAAVRPLREGDDPGALAAGDEDRRRVARALALLPRRDRSLLALAYLDDLPLAQIARLLDTPVTTVRRRLVAALERFRRALLGEGGRDDGVQQSA